MNDYVMSLVKLNDKFQVFFLFCDVSNDGNNY